MSDKIKVWDLPTRLFHWSLVVLVLVSWLSTDNGWLELHLWAGMMLLTLLVFRVVWGFVGSTTSRFSDFVRSPATALAYLRALWNCTKPKHAGHNPAGGWMVVGFIALLTLQAATGLFANDEVRFNGPLSMSVSKSLSDKLTDLHGMIFNVILVFVWAHIVAVFYYRCVKEEDLVGPMITGMKHRKYVPSSEDATFVHPIRGFLVLGLSAGLVWWLIPRVG